MKVKILLGSLFIGVAITAIPAFNAGFSPSSVAEWFFNALFATAILGFIGMKFIANDTPRAAPPSKRRKK